MTSSRKQLCTDRDSTREEAQVGELVSGTQHVALFSLHDEVGIERLQEDAPWSFS